MINYDNVTKENINKHNFNWSKIPDHPHRILITGGSSSGKTKTFFNLIKQQDIDNCSIIDKIQIYVKAPYDTKYQYLIKNTWKNGPDNLKDPKAFIEYSNNLQDVYQNIAEYNQIRKCNILAVFDDMIANKISNKKT